MKSSSIYALGLAALLFANPPAANAADIASIAGKTPASVQAAVPAAPELSGLPQTTTQTQEGSALKLSVAPVAEALPITPENQQAKGSDDDKKKKKEKVGESLDAQSVILIAANFATMAASMFLFAVGFPIFGGIAALLFIAVLIFSIMKSDRSEAARRDRLKKRAMGEEDKPEKRKNRDKDDDKKEEEKKDEKKKDEDEDE